MAGCQTSIFETAATFGFLTLSALTISGNWLVYTWAVQNEQIFQASLGYYINPLMLVAGRIPVHGRALAANAGWGSAAGRRRVSLF